MKKFFISTIALCGILSTSVFGQDKKNHISTYVDVSLESNYYYNSYLYRYNEAFVGLQYRRTFDKNYSVQVNMGYSNMESTSVGVDYLYRLPLAGNNLSFTAGLGLGIEFAGAVGRALGWRPAGVFRPQAGFDFRLPKSDFAVFWTYKPKFDVSDFDGRDLSTIQVGMGFRF